MHLDLNIPFLLWSLATLIAVVGTFSWIGQRFRDQKLRKRQRRNHGRIVTKSRRPTVALYCRIGKV